MTNRLVATFAVLVLLILSGCTTVQKAGKRDWMDLFTPEGVGAADPDRPAYGADRLEKDRRTLEALTREMQALAREMAVMRRTLVFKDQPYLSDLENKEIQLLLLRFLNARGALWDMVHFYRSSFPADPDLHTRGAVLGMSAGLNLMYFSSHFVALFHENDHLIDFFNAARPSYEIPKGIYDEVADSVTSIDNLELVDVTWYLFCKELADPRSGLAALQASDPVYCEMIQNMDGLHANLHIQVEYVLNAGANLLPEIHNRLRHSRIASIGDQLGDSLSSGLYKTRGRLFKDVARIKNPLTSLLEFSDDQVMQIKALLQPGDILLTYTAGYMSNVFLPGNFKHGITYIGSVEDRRKAGLSDEVLKSMAVSDQQAEMLMAAVNTGSTGDGFEVDIIEAVAEGVVLHSLEKLLATHINRLAVVRPAISEAERIEQLVALLRYVGTPYDFKFDFQDDSYQCCTELLYRTVNQKGSIDFSLVEMRGLWILAADDLLRYYLEQNPRAFDFILLAGQHPEGEGNRAVISTGEEGLQALYRLMEIRPPLVYSGP